jgi:polyisoprenoid-binding protein YceI
MKTATMLAAVFLTSFTFNAQAKESLDVSRYTIDREDSNIGFEVAHLMISTVSGRFDAFNGTIGYNAATDTVTSIQGVAKAASINTNQTKRDKHLRSADFLDVDKYPELTFAADQLFVKKGRTAPAKGKLTIRGVTKEIPFNVEFKGKVKDPWGT